MKDQGYVVFDPGVEGGQVFFVKEAGASPFDVFFYFRIGASND